jgi:hypothetical protein
MDLVLDKLQNNSENEDDDYGSYCEFVQNI